jgi:hypothetical protein
MSFIYQSQWSRAPFSSIGEEFVAPSVVEELFWVFECSVGDSLTFC